MTIVDDIAAIRARRDIGNTDKTRKIYARKTAVLLNVIGERLLGRMTAHNDYEFRIDSVHVTDAMALRMNITFVRPPAAPVAHTIIIVNPPCLPRTQTGNEKEDLKTALCEMLEGFV